MREIAIHTAERTRLWVLGIVVAGATFVPHAGFILGYFYRQGGQYLDAGFLAWLLGGAGVGLPIPIQLGGGSFYGTHLVPLFSLLSGCLRHTPLTTPEDFAIFTGVMNAMPAVAVYWILVGPLGWRQPGRSLLAAALGTAFGFNGFILQSMRYPHFETMICGAFMLFLVALLEGRRLLAVGFFILTLATREDGGLHAALMLAGVLFLQWRSRGSTGFANGWKVSFGFMAAGLLYAALGLTLQHWIFPGQASFLRVYVGSPPFAGVSLGSVLTRLLGFCFYRSYLILPGIVASVWAVRRNNLDVVLGFVLCLPWLVLHLVAVIPLAATMSGYYGFPVVIAMFWPLFALAVARASEGRTAAPAGETRQVLVGFGAVLAASWIALGTPYNPSRLDLATSYLALPPGREARHRIDVGIARLRELAPLLGNIGADGAVMSLAPNGFGSTIWLDPSQPSGPIAAIYFFSGSSQEAFILSRAKALHFAHFYAIDDTPLRVVTDRDLSGVLVAGLRILSPR